METPTTLPALDPQAVAKRWMEGGQGAYRSDYRMQGYSHEQVEAAFAAAQIIMQQKNKPEPEQPEQPPEPTKPRQVPPRLEASHDQIDAAIEEFSRKGRQRDLASPANLERIMSALEPHFDLARIAKANAALAEQQVGPISLRDIAFIATIHWESVTQQQGQSPINRIASAATAFGYRATPFDRRQIAIARAMLSSIAVTTEKEPKRFYGPKSRENRAAVWFVDTTRWGHIFRPRIG